MGDLNRLFQRWSLALTHPCSQQGWCGGNDHRSRKVQAQTMSEQHVKDDIALDEIPDGHGVMSMMTPKHGDLRVMWDRNNNDEVAAARASFDQMIAEGHIAYKAVGKKGDRGEVMRTFDPSAERIIMVKQNQGG